MSYATLTYYKDTYIGESKTDAATQKALNNASEDIDMVYGGPFTESDYLTTQWEYLQKACCAQAEYYVLNGEAYNEPSSGGSFSIGKFSMSEGGGSGSSQGIMANRAGWYMMQSGIGGRAIPVRGRCYTDEC